jgi:hypothetical protein
MGIGILLQSFKETMAGIGIHTQEIVHSLLQIDGSNRVHPRLSRLR